MTSAIPVKVSKAWYDRASSYLADWEDPTLLEEDLETRERVTKYLQEEGHDLVYAVVQAYLAGREHA